MRKHVLIVLALGALLAVSAVGIATAAGGETPVTVKVGNLELTANGGFTPKALSKTKQTPIELSAEGSVKESDGSHPPAAVAIPTAETATSAPKARTISTCLRMLQLSFAAAHLPRGRPRFVHGVGLLAPLSPAAFPRAYRRCIDGRQPGGRRCRRACGDQPEASRARAKRLAAPGTRSK